VVGLEAVEDGLQAGGIEKVAAAATHFEGFFQLVGGQSGSLMEDRRNGHLGDTKPKKTWGERLDPFLPYSAEPPKEHEIFKIADAIFRIVGWAIILAALRYSMEFTDSSLLAAMYWILRGLFVLAVLIQMQFFLTAIFALIFSSRAAIRRMAFAVWVFGAIFNIWLLQMTDQIVDAVAISQNAGKPLKP
jgi:hypothetical protein